MSADDKSEPPGDSTGVVGSEEKDTTPQWSEGVGELGWTQATECFVVKKDADRERGGFPPRKGRKNPNLSWSDADEKSK